MSSASIDVRYLTVHKVYPARERERWQREIYAYTNLEFATPRLDCWGDGWLEMERCTPILDLGPERSRKYRDPLRRLVERVHEAGWWHCDVALVNVVIHPARGPLLIDWENLRPRTSSISYDLYGAGPAGIEPAWEVEGGNGVWWGGPWSMCPGRYWQ